MSATINVELKSTPLVKDQRHLVLIRVTQDRAHKRFSAGIKVHKKHFNSKAKYGQWIRTSHPEHAVLNAHIKNKVEELQKEILNAEHPIKEVQIKKSFIKYAEQEIVTYNKLGKFRSAEKLRHSLNKLQKYLKNRDLMFGQMTLSFLRKYETYLRVVEDNHINTVQSDMKRLKTTYHNAIKDGVIGQDKNPFFTYRIKGINTYKEKLSSEDIEAIANLDLKADSFIWHVRNYFLFSFYCAGIRFGDLVLLKWADIKDGRLEYTMSKTAGSDGSDRSIKLVPKALSILDHYQSSEKKDNEYIFPLMPNDYNDKDIPTVKRKISSLNAQVNKELKMIQTLAKVKTKISFHISRHSAADILRKKSGNIRTIQKILGHSDIRTTSNYLAAFDHEEEDALLDESFQ